MNEKEYWLGLIKDVEKCRNELITLEEMREKYPLCDIHYYSLVVPKECPFDYAMEIIFKFYNYHGRSSILSDIEIEIPFQEEWTKLAQIGPLRKACENKDSITFSVSLFKENLLDIRSLLARGDYGDSDGYGMEPDTWLFARLNRNGEWVIPFKIKE